MSSTKTKDLEAAARWFHALADETRLQIIECLSRGEECVCDLTDMLHTSQSRLSFHLKALKDAGLLLDRREGRWIYYSLNRGAFEELQDYVDSLRQAARVRAASRCCD